MFGERFLAFCTKYHNQHKFNVNVGIHKHWSSEFTKKSKIFKIEKMQTTNAGYAGILIIQMTFLLLYVLFVRYDSGLLPLEENASAVDLDDIELQHKANYPRKFYSLFFF